MSNNKHQWKEFSNPRNGLITIKACGICGIAKSMVHDSYKCKKENNKIQLKGWKMISKDNIVYTSKDSNKKREPRSYTTYFS